MRTEAQKGEKRKVTETGQHVASNGLVNEGEATDPGPGANSYSIPNAPRLQEQSGVVDNVQPTQPEEPHLERQEDAANGPRAAGEDEDDSDSESALNSAPGSDLDEQERDGSDNDSDTPGENQDQKKDDDNDDEEGTDGDDAPEDPAGDKGKQRSQSPPTSPAKSPPKSPVDAPKTPPLQIQRNGVFSGFSPSKLFGLFTPFRSGTKTPEPPSSAAQEPVPDPHPAENQTNELADTADDSSSLHSPSEDDEVSLQDQKVSEDKAPLLLTPPMTPAKKKRSRAIISSGPVRRSQRVFKPRTSARMAQMIPINTRTAGSMGPYKALPASRMYVAHDNTGERGRNVVRMSSVTVGQKRSSSASSVSSTGSTAGGGHGRGGSNGVKRVRYAVIRG